VRLTGKRSLAAQIQQAFTGRHREGGEKVEGKKSKKGYIVRMAEWDYCQMG